MARRLASIGLAVALIVNVWVSTCLWNRHRVGPFDSQAGAQEPQSKPGAKELQYVRNGFHAKAGMNTHWKFAQIACLVEMPGWKEILPLAENQKSEILKLNGLVNRARVFSWHTDEHWPTDDLSVYLECVERSNHRRVAANAHADRLVDLGLLTEPQGAFVTQHILQNAGGRALYQVNLQELLGITAEQKQELERINKTVILEESKLGPISGDPQQRERFNSSLAALTEKYLSDCMGVLTAEQMEKWSQRTAEHTLPAEPPSLPAMSEDAETAHARLIQLSPTFRGLDENAEMLGLSDEQKKLVLDLEAITTAGLAWIDFQGRAQGGQPDDEKPGAERSRAKRAEFIRHAQQFAIDGILTEEQARQMRPATEPKSDAP